MPTLPAGGAAPIPAHHGLSPSTQVRPWLAQEAPPHRLLLPLAPRAARRTHTLSLCWHLKHPLTPQEQVFAAGLGELHPFQGGGRGGERG